MREIPVRVRGGIGGPDSPILPGRGLQPRVSTTGAAIDRIFGPPIPGPPSIGGNTLAYLGALPRNPGAPVEMLTGACYGIGLDPVWTAPTALIGLSFSPVGARAETFVIGPGDWIDLPEGIDRVWLHNADALDTILGSGFSLAGIKGYVSFLVARQPGVRPVFRTLVPHPLANIIGVMRGTDARVLAVNRLRHLYVQAYPLAAGGAITYPAAPWSASLVLNPIGWNLPGGTAFATTILDQSIPETPAFGVIAPQSPLDIGITGGSPGSTVPARGEARLPRGALAVTVTLNALVLVNAADVGFIFSGVRA